MLAVFFGEQPQIEPSNIAAYRVWSAIALAALLCGALAHLLNRGRRMLGTLWQALLVLGGTAIVALCYIPGAVDLPAPERGRRLSRPSLLLRRRQRRVCRWLTLPGC